MSASARWCRGGDADGYGGCHLQHRRVTRWKVGREWDGKWFGDGVECRDLRKGDRVHKARTAAAFCGYASVQVWKGVLGQITGRHFVTERLPLAMDVSSDGTKIATGSTDHLNCIMMCLVALDWPTVA